MEASVAVDEHRCRLPQDGKASHAYLHALIEHNPIAVVVLDSTHTFQMCNAAFSRLFQYEASEFETCGIDTLIAAPGFLDEANEATRTVLMGKQVRLRSRRRRRDGRMIDVDIIGVPLLIDGQVEGIFGLYQHVVEPVETVQDRQQLPAQRSSAGSGYHQRFPPRVSTSLSQELALLNSNLHLLGGLLPSAGDDAAEVLHEARELAAVCGDRIRSLEEHLSGVATAMPFRPVANATEASCIPSLRSQNITERETEIVQLLACGLSSKEVAGRLDIGTRTVETHRLNVYRKLQLRNVADLVLYAVRNGLLRLA